ncbi:hypothetical protein P7K49_012081 [Saguinus oedipus]|uniref:Uncharacterized protein n=1 Tax=Saguinus oedipus TaxID=9490 RepID=A0ABQ9VSH1_SAGOE|nr:hypothetical protein P7K49_012081 [Saguinus oedipus]
MEIKASYSLQLLTETPVYPPPGRPRFKQLLWDPQRHRQGCEAMKLPPWKLLKFNHAAFSCSSPQFQQLSVNQFKVTWTDGFGPWASATEHHLIQVVEAGAPQQLRPATACPSAISPSVYLPVWTPKKRWLQGA